MRVGTAVVVSLCLCFLRAQRLHFLSNVGELDGVLGRASLPGTMTQQVRTFGPRSKLGPPAVVQASTITIIQALSAKPLNNPTLPTLQETKQTINTSTTGSANATVTNKTWTIAHQARKAACGMQLPESQKRTMIFDGGCNLTNTASPTTLLLSLAP